MKKDKQTVLDNIKKMDNSKLHFVVTDWFNEKPDKDQSRIKEEVHYLKLNKDIKDRILKIMSMADDFDTYDENNKHQCDSGTNRSAEDIWRIYNRYFRPVTIFTIMRALYELVVIDNDLETLYCHDIDKQVFCNGSSYDDVFEMNELGVRFAEWRTIGL